MQRNKTKKNKAFTLIELLTTISIVGMLGLGIMSVFGSGLRVYERVQNFGNTQTDVLLALEQFERDLRNTFVFASINFVGETEQIYFPGIIDNVDATGMVKTAIGALEYVFDRDTKSLLFDRELYPSSSIKTEETGEVLASIEALTFTYYYLDTETKSYKWQNTWSKDDEGMPKGVKIKLIFKDGDNDVAMERMVLIPTG